MATKGPPTDEAGGKRKGRRNRAGRPEPAEAQRPDQTRRLVDIDPWAVLLEQLMEIPEEEPAERTRAKGK